MADKTSKPGPIDVEADVKPWGGDDTVAGVDATPVTPTETALATIDPDDQALTTGGGPAYSDKPEFDLSELLIPRLRVANGLTAEVQSGDARPGQWLLMGFEPEEKAEVVVLSMARRRELRDSENEDRGIICRSDDAKFGVGDPGGACETCPMAQWGAKGPNGKSKPAPCVFIYSYQCYSLTHGSLCMLEFKRSSLNSAKQVNSALAQRGARNFVITLTSNQVKGPRGPYYTPTLSNRKITPEERASVDQATNL